VDEYHLEVWRDGAWRPVGGAASLDYCLGRISERWSSPGPRLAMRCVSNDGSVIHAVKAREELGYGIGVEHLSPLDYAAAAIRMLEALGIGGERAGLMALIEGALRELAKQCKPPSEPLLPALASLDGDALAEWLGERGLEAPHWGSQASSFGSGSGSGAGAGSGWGSGRCYAPGIGDGTGEGEIWSDGSGWGSGSGSGSGTGWGSGPGWGDGNGLA